jgi:HTH-type transcriptional regulator / antitoxin HigA
MTTKIHRDLPADAPESYEELARLYIPRKIHDKIGQQNATEVVDWLSIRAHTADQIEFLDFVSDLLDEYESQFLKDSAPGDPLEVLRYLVEENGITTRELGKILGVDHSIAARILKGERGITVEHAKHLGARFKVDAQLFLKLK